MSAMIVGAALALVALGYVLYPLLTGAQPRERDPSGFPCPNCGELTQPEASYCPRCGEALPGTKGMAG